MTTHPGQHQKSGLEKAPTGIVGLDLMTHGGLPKGRISLVAGHTGTGKTLLSLQFLLNGVLQNNEPGLFIAFEEHPDQIHINASSLYPALKSEKAKQNLHFINAQPSYEFIQSGSFDLKGLLAVLIAKAEASGIKRIVFDALDVYLDLLNSPEEKKREINRLKQWLAEHGFTAVLTMKSDSHKPRLHEKTFDFLPFMVDCLILLRQQLEDGVSSRTLRILKYRGSGYEENEAPLLIGQSGLVVGLSMSLSEAKSNVDLERLSSGIPQLDTMLGGGYFRSSSVLVTGEPGTAKTTLAGAFLQAACQRNEKAMMVSFDSDSNEVIRNLASVQIRLNRFLDQNILKIYSARAARGNADYHLMQVIDLAKQFNPKCVVIDPISALLKAGSGESVQRAVERAIDWFKTNEITLLCTSLLDKSAEESDPDTRLQISTIADVWIQLNYLVRAGERNRGISIVKARGTGHSSQVRELILSSNGIRLSPVYTAGGEVLMGTLRWEKEQAEQEAIQNEEAAIEEKKLKLASEEAELNARLETLRKQIQGKIIEREHLINQSQQKTSRRKQRQNSLGELRNFETGNPSHDE